MPFPSKRTCGAGVTANPLPLSVRVGGVSNAVRIGVMLPSHGLTAKTRAVVARPFSATLTSACGPASRLAGSVMVRR